MKRTALIVCLSVTLLAQSKVKYLPNQASDDDVELVGTVLLDRAAIQKELGADLGDGFSVVKITITPKTEIPLHISPDDFTLISRKNGEQSGSISPHQIAGKGVLVVHPATSQSNGLGTVSSGPVWGGLGGARPQRLPGGGSGNGVGNSGTEGGTVSSTINQEKGAAENPLLAVLQSKTIPEKDSKEPVEGLLYFALDGKKLKAKDMALRYSGKTGRLIIDFK